MGSFVVEGGYLLIYHNGNVEDRSCFFCYSKSLFLFMRSGEIALSGLALNLCLVS